MPSISACETAILNLLSLNENQEVGGGVVLEVISRIAEWERGPGWEGAEN